MAKVGAETLPSLRKLSRKLAGLRFASQPPGQAAPWVELRCELGCVIGRFSDFQLPDDAADSTIWRICQDSGILLITGNRNAEGVKSLELTLRLRNFNICLPVLTLADPDRVGRDRPYAETVVERLFEVLIDIDSLRGTGCLYLS